MAQHRELAILTMLLFTSFFCLFVFNLEVSKTLPMSGVSAELLFRGKMDTYLVPNVCKIQRGIKSLGDCQTVQPFTSKRSKGNGGRGKA